MIKLILQNETHYKIPPETALSTWINAAARASQQKIPASQQQMTVCIVSREESARLNEKFRAKSGATNVLSFPDEPFGDITPDSLGDLAICAELVSLEAQEQQKELEAHWAHLVIHGTLHLLGFDHVKEEEAEVMEALEIHILDSLNFKNPYV